MFRAYKTHGIVIRRRNIKETDKLLTIFTRDKGKITVIAKGIRNIRSRRAAHLELFHIADLTIAIGSHGDIVSEANMTRAHTGIRTNLRKMAYAYRMAEAVDQLCADQSVHQDVFVLLSRSLRMLSEGDEHMGEEHTETFLLHLLHALGYLPPHTILTGTNLLEFFSSISEKSLRSDRFLDRVV